MSFITASFYDTGSYISGTVDSFFNETALTTIYAPTTYIYSASAITGTIENYSNGSANTTIYAPQTYRYSGGVHYIVKQKPITGPFTHTAKPNKL